MSSIERALERGEGTRRSTSKWEPVGVTYPGWLTAHFQHADSGKRESVFYAQGKWQYTTVGYDHKTEKAKSFDCRDRELKRMAKSMLEPDDPEERAELIRDCAALRAASVAEKLEQQENGGTPTKRARRGKQ